MPRSVALDRRDSRVRPVEEAWYLALLVGVQASLAHTVVRRRSRTSVRDLTGIAISCLSAGKDRRPAAEVTRML